MGSRARRGAGIACGTESETSRLGRPGTPSRREFGFGQRRRPAPAGAGGNDRSLAEGRRVHATRAIRAKAGMEASLNARVPGPRTS